MIIDAIASRSSGSPAGGALLGIHRAWWMAAVSFVGLAFGQTAMVFLTLGVFMKPLNQEFGWSRGQVAIALSVGALVLLFTTPVVGRFIDRRGPRKVMLPSMAGLGILLCSMYFLTNSLIHFYVMFAIIGVVGAAANNVSYVRVLAAWFARSRGLAIGIASSGVAAGQTIGIGVAQTMITEYSWRLAYVAIGLSILLVGLPIVALFLRDQPSDVGLAPLGAQDQKGASVQKGTADASFGVEKSAALRMPVFWALIFIAFVMATALHGIQIHFVPLLLDAGISPGLVAGLFVSLLTVGAIVGRLGTGFLFDRFFAPHVAIVAFALPMVGLLLVLNGADTWALFAGAVFFGIGLGSEADVLGYFTSRYFGLKAMGEIYGYIFGVFMAGSAAGPALYGIVQAKTGNYDAPLIASAAMLISVCVVCALLPRFRDTTAAT